MKNARRHSRTCLPAIPHGSSRFSPIAGGRLAAWHAGREEASDGDLQVPDGTF